MKSNPLKPNSEQGAVLIILLLILTMAATSSLFTVLDSDGIKIEREKRTALALAEAKAALIGFVVKTPDIATPSYLPNPDLHLSPVIPEGSESSNSGAADLSLIGKFPWYSLDTSPLRDGWNECLWYVVSGRYKKSPHTSVFNWDTQGQIDVVDSKGSLIASNLAALVIAPGPILADQNRSLTSISNKQCGGNYDARNYLDSYTTSNSIVGEVNYFSSSTNNRQAPNTSNKRFVLTNNDYYNDQLMFLTIEELFKPIIRRNDFKAQITNLLDDPYFKIVAVTGSKGTDSVNDACTSILEANKIFCHNWKEMLLLTQLSSSISITIDGVPSTCDSRIIIFGGKKTNLQARAIAANKNDPANYLEGNNLAAFIATSSGSIPIIGFNGSSTFDPSNANADILKCL